MLDLSSDISARWGEDKFILLLHDCSLAQAHRMEARLSNALASTILFTAGIAEFTADDTGESSLARADKQLLEKQQTSLRRITDAALEQEYPEADQPATVTVDI